MTILVVDDEQDVESLFRQRFRREVKDGKIELTFAFTGAAALEAFEARGADGFDFILVDLNMPDANGLDLLKEFKARSAGQVFIVTGFGDSENQKKAHAAGCDCYLTKPVDFEDLRQRFGVSE